MIRDWLLTGEHSCWASYGCVMPWMQHFTSLLSFSSYTLSALFFTVFSNHRGGGTDTLFNAKYPVLIYPKHPEQSWIAALKTLTLNKEPFLFGMKCAMWRKLLGPLTCPQSESLLPGGRSSLLLLVWLLTSFFSKFTERKLNCHIGRSVNIYMKAPDILKILGFE